MRRTSIFITIGIILIMTGIVWIYQFTQKEKATLWDIISNDAVLIIEFPGINSMDQKLKELPALDKALSSNKNMRSILNNKLFQGRKVLLTIQPIARDDFGFLVYTEVSATTWQSELKNIGFPFSDSNIKKRIYNGIEINELAGEKFHLSFALIDDILVLSESSFLLEGVLRLRTLNTSNLFKNQNPGLFKLPTLKSDEGNIYINISRFTDFLTLFKKSDLGKGKLLLNGSGLADIKISEQGVLLNGFLINSKDGLLNLFEKQKPQPIDVEDLISNKVAAVTHFGISETEQWFNDQKELAKKGGITSIDSLEEEMLRLSVSIESLRGSVGNQFANCYLDKDDQVVNILKLNEEPGRISVFDELSSKLSDQKRDSLYIENYAGYQIKLIDYKNFLYQLFYPLAPPSEQTFFAQVGKYLILSESVELIKSFIDDMDTEDTWGKSVEWNKFLNTTLQESNVTVFLDGKLTSVFLRNRLNTKWRSIFDANDFMGIDKGAFQLSRLETNYYLNTSLQFLNPSHTQSSLIKTTYNFGAKIVTQPKIVRNHISKDIEIVMQDSAHNLYLLSKDLKTLWKKPINDHIVDVKQLDFYANGKLQLFFTTKKQVHVIDRLGNFVDGFPKSIDANSRIEHSQLVDYDRSKRYRYLLTEEVGDLLLSDKNGNLLEGWNPRKLNGRMLVAARHYRILGKDYFLAVTRNGVVNLMNRRGEMIKGFPLNLSVRPKGNVSITMGNGISSTYFTVVSKEGLKVQFGLDGQIRKSEVLLKRTASSEFSLVKSISEDAYVFLRVDPEKVAILDTEGKDLIEIENPGSVNWSLTYLENRLKERFYCLYDEQQNFSYYLDSTGKLLLPQPLESTQLPSLIYDEKQKSLSIYNTDESSLSLISIKM